MLAITMASHDENTWMSFVSAFEIKDSIHYYQERPGSHEGSPRLHENVLESLAGLTIYGIASVSADKPLNRVQNALDNQNIHERLSALDLPNIQIKPSLLCWPKESDRPTNKHIQVWVKENPSLENEIRKISKDFAHNSYIKYYLDDRILRQQIKDSLSGEIESEYVLSHAPAPDYHPAMMYPEASAFCRTTEEAIEVMNQIGSKETKDLVKIYKTEKATDHSEQNLPRLIVAIEGIDAVGKTTLTAAVAKELKAKLFNFDRFINLRPYFDSMPELIGRAFFRLGNAILSEMLYKQAENGTVIMDRFWHSTSAYNVANECACGDESVLPPPGHWCYQWPSDLVQPHIILLLNVSEEVRDSRLRNRQGEISKEEEALKKNHPFRKRLLEAYRRVVHPKVIEIDASKSKEDVLTKALQIIKDYKTNNW